MALRIVQTLRRATRGQIVLPLVAFILLLYVVVPKLGDFSASSQIVREAKIDYLILATVIMICNYVVAAGIYQFLSLRPLPFRRTVLVQAATAFVNRTLPAGIGSVTLFTVYLRKSGYRLAESVAIVTMNNVLGIAGHLLLLVIAVLFGGSDILSGWWRETSGAKLLLLLIVPAIVLGLSASRKVRQTVRRFVRDTAVEIGLYRHAPLRLLGAFGLSVSMTMLHVMALYLCAAAVGAPLSVWNVFLAYTAGAAAGTVTPTPGGLGGVEAGLVAGLIAFGVDAATALAAVLLYRFITYWLFILPGFVVFLKIRRRYL